MLQMTAHSKYVDNFITTVRYRHSTVAEKAYAENLVLSKSCIPTKLWKFINYVSPQKRSKNTFKPEIQGEWTHLLYKCKVKNTLCGNAWPRTPPLELNRATTSLICEKACHPQLFFWFRCPWFHVFHTIIETVFSQSKLAFSKCYFIKIYICYLPVGRTNMTNISPVRTDQKQ